MSSLRCTLLSTRLLFFCPFWTSFAFANSPTAVGWQAQRLSVQASKAPLSQVLREVSRQTGIEIRGAEALQQKVSIAFSRQPLNDAIRTLLAKMNYAIVEEQSANGEPRPVRILILGRRNPADRKLVPVAQAPVYQESDISEHGMEIPTEEVPIVVAASLPGRALADEQSANANARPPSQGAALEDEQARNTRTPQLAGIALNEEHPAALKDGGHQLGTPLEGEAASTPKTSPR
ncbi:MAG: hypothetical protein ACHBNF_12695 [Chromatiales bacterium]